MPEALRGRFLDSVGHVLKQIQKAQADIPRWRWTPPSAASRRTLFDCKSHSTRPKILFLFFFPLYRQRPPDRVRLDRVPDRVRHQHKKVPGPPRWRWTPSSAASRRTPSDCKSHSTRLKILFLFFFPLYRQRPPDRVRQDRVPDRVRHQHEKVSGSDVHNLKTFNSPLALDSVQCHIPSDSVRLHQIR